MGINVNVSPRIQQNTPLRTVRSGATAEPDNNVKYVPQTLTEAQQAQARQNIGAISESEVPAQVQADWNQSDDTAPDYIKNKPNIDTKYFGNVMDMYNTLTVFTTRGGTSVQPNNGAELGNVKDIIIGAQNLNGLTMYDTPRNEDGCGIYRTTWIIDPQKMQYNGYWRFYPGGEMHDLWMYPGMNDDSQKGPLDTPIQEIWCKDVNIVLRGKTGAYGNYKRINRIKSNLQLVTKFTVWNTTNTGWQGLWDGTGDVVLFDTEMEKFVEAVNAPNALIGFKIYMPKSRYTEFVSAMTTAWGSTAVNDYILPKVEQYDFVYSEGFKYKMVNSVPLTMTDADGNTISGDFVANNITITPAV